MVFLGLLLGAIVLWLMSGNGQIHVKLVIAAAAFALVGLWRLLRAPYWMRRPDEVERIDRAAPANRMHIIMRSGRLFELAVTVAEREEVERAIVQRANEIRLRARIVVR